MTKEELLRILRCDGSKDYGLLKLALINAEINGDETLSVGAYDFYIDRWNSDLSITAMYDCIYTSIFECKIKDGDIDWEAKKVSSNIYNSVEKCIIDFFLRVGAIST